MPKILKDFFEQKGKKGVQNLIIMLVLGIVLLVAGAYFTRTTSSENSSGDNNLLSQFNNQEREPNTTSSTSVNISNSLAEELGSILSLIVGAGEVRVMVSIGNATNTFAQNINESTSATTEQDSEGGVRNVESINNNITYVMVRQSDGSEAPLLITAIAPSIEGVIVVAQGGGDPFVRDSIVRAVQALLGVPAHRIQVLQMQ